MLDEPTTGWDWSDIQHLTNLLFKLPDQGNTIIIIEHNIDVTNLADGMVKLGPTGGNPGGHMLHRGLVVAFKSSTETPPSKTIQDCENNFDIKLNR